MQEACACAFDFFDAFVGSHPSVRTHTPHAHTTTSTAYTHTRTRTHTRAAFLSPPSAAPQGGKRASNGRTRPSLSHTLAFPPKLAHPC